MAWTVYIHKFPNGKVYIGITSKSAEKRWRDGKGYKTQKLMWKAIKKYGWNNIEHLVLYENLEETEAKSKEKELIKQYNSNDRKYGYNLTIGGDGVIGYTYTDEAKEKMRQAQLGHKASTEAIENMKKAKKGHPPTLIEAVAQYDKNKNLIAIWDGIYLIQQILNINAHPSLRKKYKPFERKCGGYYWVKLRDLCETEKQKILKGYNQIKIYMKGKIINE